MLRVAVGVWWRPVAWLSRTQPKPRYSPPQFLAFRNWEVTNLPWIAFYSIPASRKWCRAVMVVRWMCGTRSPALEPSTFPIQTRNRNLPRWCSTTPIEFLQLARVSETSVCGTLMMASCSNDSWRWMTLRWRWLISCTRMMATTLPCWAGVGRCFSFCTSPPPPLPWVHPAWRWVVDRVAFLRVMTCEWLVGRMSWWKT